MAEYGFDKTEFMKFHLPVYIIVLVSLAIVYMLKNPLYWQFYISGGSILMAIVAFLRYGPKD